MLPPLVPPGVQPETLYPLPSLEQITGLKKAWWRSARRAGLRMRYTGGRAFCLGRDFIQHVADHSKDTKGGPAKETAVV